MLQEACLWQPPEIKDHFEQHIVVGVLFKQAPNVWRHHPQE
jgi:hypothetical protein